MKGSSLKTAYSQYPTAPMSNYSTNNKYKNFPPLMNDGRALIGGYTPESVQNAKIIQNFGIENNWQYRQFMTTNAVKIGQDNFALAANDIGYTSRSLDILAKK